MAAIVFLQENKEQSADRVLKKGQGTGTEVNHL